MNFKSYSKRPAHLHYICACTNDFNDATCLSFLSNFHGSLKRVQSTTHPLALLPPPQTVRKKLNKKQKTLPHNSLLLPFLSPFRHQMVTVPLTVLVLLQLELLFLFSLQYLPPHLLLLSV